MTTQISSVSNAIKIVIKLLTVQQDSFCPKCPNPGETPKLPERNENPRKFSQTGKPLRRIINQPFNVTTRKSSSWLFPDKSPTDKAVKHFKLRAMAKLNYQFALD